MLVEHLNHRMPIYQECSLYEIMTMGLVILGLSLLLFPLATECLVGNAATGLVTAFLGTLVMTRLAISQLSSLKAGKPQGYYSQWIRLWLDQHYLYTAPYVRRIGYWTTGR